MLVYQSVHLFLYTEPWFHGRFRVVVTPKFNSKFASERWWLEDNDPILFGARELSMGELLNLTGV